MARAGRTCRPEVVEVAFGGGDHAVTGGSRWLVSARPPSGHGTAGVASVVIAGAKKAARKRTKTPTTLVTAMVRLNTQID
jgi:hypothetical protein